MLREKPRLATLVWLATLGLGLGGCTTLKVPSPDTVLSENEIINMITHPSRWEGRTVTVQIFPFDNGFNESFVACLERCDADYAAHSAVLIYTKAGRFKGYHGDTPFIVKAAFRKICPDDMPVCLDDRIFALDESD